jgi:hypothetical protein
MPVEFEASASNVASERLSACSFAACFLLAWTRAFDCGILAPSEPQFDVRARMPSSDRRHGRPVARRRRFNRQ